jgi:RNA polymerase II subunit A-like phosphatase
MIHDNNSLRVSQNEASRVEEEVKRRLLKSKKLSLVVDLDQTIIHATVDPTVAEWQHDTENPNHEAVKEVRAFQLIDDGPGARGCWYYIKLRPGLSSFLENISKIYELHIYTMGTRAYAQNIAKIVDPERKIFGDRILSRDESGSLTAKNLQRLFPVDTKMVVIIDDRGDVWKWSDNLIKVSAYDFFVGIGDINSSFLPKKQELNMESQATAAGPSSIQESQKKGERVEKFDNSSAVDGSESAPPDQVESSSTEISTLEQLVSMGGGDDPDILEQQTSRQDEAITAQVEDRPLLQMQKQIDAEDEAAAAAAGPSTTDLNGDSHMSEDQSDDSGKHRHNLLVDDDTELEYLQQSLTDVHRTFFDEYEQKLASASGGRVAALRGEKRTKKVAVKDGADLEIVPDIKTIMPQMKLRVLEGVVLVLTGVIPLGFDVQVSDIGMWAKSFGARILEHVNRHVTHIIAGRPRTTKVRQAAKRPNVKIVTPHWLSDSISRWQRLDEGPYLLPLHPDDRNPELSSSNPRDNLFADADPGLSSADDEGGSTDDDRELELHLDEIFDAEGVMPNELDDNISPIEELDGVNWDETNDELAEFLGSEAGDSDVESIGSNSSLTSDLSRAGSRSDRKRKRSRTPSLTDDSSEGRGGNANSKSTSSPSSQPNSSQLAKRKKMARSRSSNLKSVARVENGSTATAMPESRNRDGDVDRGGHTEDYGEDNEDYDDDDKDNDNDNDNDEDEDEDFEKLLEAEMEAAQLEKGE